MTDISRVTEDLRARLATESLLTQKHRELQTANTRIAEQARTLTDEVIRRRQEAERARIAAERLKGKNREALKDLRQARSEQQIAERRLWASLEAMEDGFAVFDANARIVSANRAFFRPFEDLECVQLGTTWAELVELAVEEGIVDPGDRSPSAWIAAMKAHWNEGEGQPVTLRLWNDHFVRLTTQRTPDGDMVLTAVDMTQTMRREKELERARHDAEAASRAKSAFLANMSHEIRTPMNGVLAMADLLAENDLTDEQQICVDTIRSSGEALLVIINDVLDYSKIEAEKLRLLSDPFDLEAVANDVVTLLMPSAHEKSISLVVDYDMFLPTGYLGDKGRLRQVLMNLVGNAIKFTEEGHVVVRITGLANRTTETCQLHITVEDTGVGIPADKLEHIFGEFNQADGAMTRQFDGTGLGLAITRRLVGLMGGKVWVDSTEGKGSVFGFRVDLPLDPNGCGAVAPGSVSDRRVVVADPDPASRSVLVKQLMALGLKPDLLADGTLDERAGPLGARDVLVAAERDGPTGRVRLALGGASAEDGQVLLPRPVLRRHLLDGLQTILDAEPAEIAETGDGQPEEPEVDVLRPMRVLAAEDNKVNRLVLEKLLGSLDIEIVVAVDGAQAVEMFCAERPDLVLTDISMPRLDGKDAARAMRAHEAATGLDPVRIVAMTAHVMEEDRREFLAAGIDEVLTKPLKKDALVAEITGAAPEGVRPPVASA